MHQQRPFTRFLSLYTIPIKINTPLEIKRQGPPELALDAPAPKTVTVLDAAKEATATFVKTLCDPNGAAEFYRSAATLEWIADLTRGVQPSTVVVSQPFNSEQVSAAGHSMLEAQEEVALISPLAYQQINWQGLGERVATVDSLTEERQRLEDRLDGIINRQAQARQLVYNELDQARTLMVPLSKVHRGLGRTLTAYNELFYGPAEKGVETKKVSDRSEQKGEAKAEAKAEDKAKAEAKADDKPAASKKPTDPTDK